MNGYVINKSSAWRHALKRAIRPGGEIPLDELYVQYGKKYNLSEGKDFVDWLRKVKLRDAEIWDIVLKEETQEKLEDLSLEAKKELKAEISEGKKRVDMQSPFVPKTVTIEELVELSVRNARDMLPKITDLKLLKYTLQEASVRSGKDSLCREIRKRIKQLEIGRGH